MFVFEYYENIKGNLLFMLFLHSERFSVKVVSSTAHRPPSTTHRPPIDHPSTTHRPPIDQIIVQSPTSHLNKWNINVFVDFHKKFVKNEKMCEIYGFCIKALLFRKNVHEVLEIRRNLVFFIEIYIKVWKIIKSKEIN